MPPRTGNDPTGSVSDRHRAGRGEKFEERPLRGASLRSGDDPRYCGPTPTDPTYWSPRSTSPATQEGYELLLRPRVLMREVKRVPQQPTPTCDKGRHLRDNKRHAEVSRIRVCSRLA